MPSRARPSPIPAEASSGPKQCLEGVQPFLPGAVTGIFHLLLFLLAGAAGGRCT